MVALIDIGANIGTYTMYSSSIGRKTISIECYQPNIDRIVRAIQIENTSKYVTLIENAIYNQSGEYLELSKDNSNVGGQALITNQTMEYLSLNSNPFRGYLTKKQNFYLIFFCLVVTTRFDDLYPIFIKNKISIAIMKIDIQLSEIFLCQSGYKIFDSINIVLVQMEWSDIKLKKDYADFIIDFFTERNYLSVSTDNCQILNSTNTNYTTWGTPFDIYWIKSDYYHICRS
jgi:FkbM family methyltransferase